MEHLHWWETPVNFPKHVPTSSIDGLPTFRSWISHPRCGWNPTTPQAKKQVLLFRPELCHVDLASLIVNIAWGESWLSTFIKYFFQFNVGLKKHYPDLQKALVSLKIMLWKLLDTNNSNYISCFVLSNAFFVPSSGFIRFGLDILSMVFRWIIISPHQPDKILFILKSKFEYKCSQQHHLKCFLFSNKNGVYRNFWPKMQFYTIGNFIFQSFGSTGVCLRQTHDLVRFQTASKLKSLSYGSKIGAPWAWIFWIELWNIVDTCLFSWTSWSPTIVFYVNPPCFPPKKSQIFHLSLCQVRQLRLDGDLIRQIGMTWLGCPSQ